MCYCAFLHIIKPHTLHEVSSFLIFVACFLCFWLLCPCHAIGAFVQCKWFAPYLFSCWVNLKAGPAYLLSHDNNLAVLLEKVPLYSAIWFLKSYWKSISSQRLGPFWYTRSPWMSKVSPWFQDYALVLDGVHSLLTFFKERGPHPYIWRQTFFCIFPADSLFVCWHSMGMNSWTCPDKTTTLVSCSWHLALCPLNLFKGFFFFSDYTCSEY